MAYIINGKVKRNTTEQVLKNANDILDLQEDVSALQSESSTIVQEVSDLGQKVEKVATDLGNLETSVVNKTATPNVVYGNDQYGNQSEYSISVTGSPTAGSIATFDASGRLQSLSPTSNSDVATKQYVDSHSSSSHLYMHQIRIRLNDSRNSHVYTTIYSDRSTAYTDIEQFPYDSSGLVGHYQISGRIGDIGTTGTATYLDIDFMTGKSYYFYFVNTAGDEAYYHYNGWETEDPSPSIDSDAVVQIF